MPCVDDRFLTLLGENCKWLTSVNFNGCKFVTDKGLAKLARCVINDGTMHRCTSPARCVLETAV
jgi:hypothetical protein